MRKYRVPPRTHDHWFRPGPNVQGVHLVGALSSLMGQSLPWVFGCPPRGGDDVRRQGWCRSGSREAGRIIAHIVSERIRTPAVNDPVRPTMEPMTEGPTKPPISPTVK